METAGSDTQNQISRLLMEYKEDEAANLDYLVHMAIINPEPI